VSTRALIYPVFLPRLGCAGTCVYCDQARISGAGSFDLEVSLRRAGSFVENHPGQSKQIAFYGGSFTALEPDLRQELIDRFSTICDGTTSFRISTHPGYIDAPILTWCRASRITTIELGIQDFSTEVLSLSQRGYTVETAFEAALMVREAGFELGIQLMPGLPGSDQAALSANLEALRMIKPSFIRLYPVIVIKGTGLQDWYEQGTYAPLTLEQAISICADYCEFCSAEGIRVAKLGLPSNLPVDEVAAGPFHPAFGELVKAELALRKALRARHPDGSVSLSSSQMRLLQAHGGLYHKIMLNRIGNCSVSIID
jgi:histone acetyltransferase (RNA polymerase elongator complex component)